jgi:hypothetical protein
MAEMTPRTWKLNFSGDILIVGTASWFGGDNDPDDDGQTASGLVTKGNPTLMGCALPIPTCAATAGSPLPKLPYLSTFVEVMANGKTITVPLIDVGPALDQNRPIDLTVAAFQALGGDLQVGLIPNCRIRIIGAATLYQA